jgi:hypothetical protein
MSKKINILFLLLISAHVIHAIEEYLGHLWDIYPPAIFICNLVSSDPERGFIILNVTFTILSLLFWKFSLQKKRSSSHSLIWLWVVLQFVNVIGHTAWTISKKSYTPGIFSAILIVIIVGLLVIQLTKTVGMGPKRNVS